MTGLLSMTFEQRGFRVRVWQRPDGRWGGLLERLAARGWVGVAEVLGSEAEVSAFMLGEDRWADAGPVCSLLADWFATRTVRDCRPL